MLNEKQQQIYDAIVKNTNPNFKTFFLKGKAGSGKSYVISQIAKDYPSKVLLTATTNKAKNLLQQATGIKAYTTHSALGFVMTRNGVEEYLSDINEALLADLLIVDEVSMLPNQVYQKIISLNYKHILFVGDECQLPAIGLKANINADLTIELTEQMRQEDNEELAKWLENMREYISSKRMINLETNLPKGIITYSDHKEFCKAYLECEVSKRILAYSNRVIDSYNLNINNQIHFSPGDLLVLDKPLGEVKNGDIVEVVSVNKESDHYLLTVAFNGCVYEMIVFFTKSAESSYLNNLLKDTPFKYWEEKDKIFHPKHLYASTIHKAQGQTIDEVFIDVLDIFSQLTKKPTKFNNYNKPISIQEYMKLLYVAISRMKIKAHLFIGDKRDYKALRSKR